MKFFNYSHKGGLPAGVFPKYKHPLVKKWVEEIWEKHLKGEIELPKHHGKCAEIMNIDEYLHSIDPLGNIKTQEQAQKAFEGFVSHARQIDKNVIENHNTYKPACKSCISVLKDFGIKEYKIQ